MSKKVPKARRREKKTDYKQRLGLLKSGNPRLVVRKSSGNTVTQIVRWKEDGDEVIEQAEAQDLRELGWKGHTGNLPSAYLAGFLLGSKVENDIGKCVLDIGLQETTRENRIYAALKGAMDAGIEVSVGEEMLPSEDRIRGEHIEDHASEMNSKKKKEHFSSLIERSQDPENISENFEEVKKNIAEGDY